MGGGGIEQNRDAVSHAEAYGGIDRLRRDFQLQHDELALADVGSGTGNIIGRQQLVRALDDDDGIVSIGINENGCDAAGCRAFQDVAGVDAVHAKVGDGVVGKDVVADAA